MLIKNHPKVFVQLECIHVFLHLNHKLQCIFKNLSDINWSQHNKNVAFPLIPIPLNKIQCKQLYCTRWSESTSSASALPITELCIFIVWFYSTTSDSGKCFLRFSQRNASVKIFRISLSLQTVAIKTIS